MRTIHRDINYKSRAITRFEKKKGEKSSLIEKQRILCEWYGVYFKF